MSGLVGCMSMSTKPALSLMNLDRVQVAPPSVVLYSPRSGLLFQGAPSAATYTMLGLVGCTTTLPMAWVFSSPISFQVRPASVDLKIPPPGEIELRELGSPLPAQTMLVSEGAMAMSPIEMIG